jgi:hypothetical protein
MQEMQQQSEQLRQAQRVPELFFSRSQQQRVTEAAALDGRHISRERGGLVKRGVLRFLGAEARPSFFVIEYPDGERESAGLHKVRQGKGYRLAPPAG